MERSILNIKRRDRVRKTLIRETNCTDVTYKIKNFISKYGYCTDLKNHKIRITIFSSLATLRQNDGMYDRRNINSTGGNSNSSEDLIQSI